MSSSPSVEIAHGVHAVSEGVSAGLAHPRHHPNITPFITVPGGVALMCCS